MRIKIELELIENYKDNEDLKDVVYAYLTELIEDGSLSFDVVKETCQLRANYIGDF